VLVLLMILAHWHRQQLLLLAVQVMVQPLQGLQQKMLLAQTKQLLQARGLD
jgi:hypothetical protein